MKLIVMAGAKQGTEIPLKKDKFVIGRSRDCTLRAGSDAISRHHCVLLRTSDGYTIRDLGSRNGTYVNGERIAAETELKHHDTVRVGPLEFRCEMAVDIDRSKKPKVKDVADAVARTGGGSASGESDVFEDDISRWLIGPELGSAAMNETQNFRVDDTHSLPVKRTIEMPVDTAKGQPEETSDENSEEKSANQGDEAKVSDEKGDEAKDTDAKGDKKDPKKQPGKLPPLPPKLRAKDSREAAASILRELGRRR